MEGVEGHQASGRKGLDPGRHQPCHQHRGAPRARGRADRAPGGVRRPRKRDRRNRLRLCARPIPPARPSLDHVGEARGARGGGAAGQQGAVELRKSAALNAAEESSISCGIISRFGGSFMAVLLRVLALPLLAAALLAPASTASAQAYPSKPVKIIVPFAPGGPADVFARQIGQHLSETLKQSFVIEDRPGAGSIIGTDAVAKSAPDGYTLLMMSNTHTT